MTGDGEPTHGFPLAGICDRLGAKLVCLNLDLAVGDDMRVGVA